MEEIRITGATKIQAILRGNSVRKKEVKFNDVVEKKIFRTSEAIRIDLKSAKKNEKK